jgi:hypothetical protein
MATVVTVDPTYARNDTSQSTQIVRGTITLSGNYGTSTSHGDTLSFANVYGIQSRSIPLRVFIYEQPAAGVAPTFFEATYQAGTTNANGAVNFQKGGTELTEAVAYSSANVGSPAIWKFEAIFPTFV